MKSQDPLLFDLLDIVEIYCRRRLRGIERHLATHNLVSIEELRLRRDYKELLGTIESINLRYIRRSDDLLELLDPPYQPA